MVNFKIFIIKSHEAYMTKIYLVRHGQTEWNKKLTFRGRVDIQLNETGHREARAILDALKNKNIDAIYTSPLKRSIETAQPIADYFHLEVVPVQGLIDINYGDWEGLTFNEVKKRYSNQYDKWEKKPDSIRFPHGETLDEVRERAFRNFKDIVKKNSGKSILIVPHRVINKVLLCALLGLSNSHFWEIRQDTACINLIEYLNNRFILSLMNDTCHLKEIADGIDQPDF
jgi:broad specificity phosphatase PhoE